MLLFDDKGIKEGAEGVQGHICVFDGFSNPPGAPRFGRSDTPRFGFHSNELLGAYIAFSFFSFFLRMETVGKAKINN